MNRFFFQDVGGGIIMQKKILKSSNSTLVVDTTKSQHAKIYPVSIKNIQLEDLFWAPRLRVLRETTLPSQYEQLEKTGRLHNFRRASGKEKGEYEGLVFNDSDVYKWVEAASFALAKAYDEKLSLLVKKVVNDIVAAQDEDGYLNSYFMFERKKERWTNLKDKHELYCAGHFMQAAVAYYRATGERLLLASACRFADHIASVFGPKGRVGTPGHPEIEMALVELYRATGKKDYLQLARFFIDERGKGHIGGSTYHIDHRPFRDLNEIVGHAVRSVYLNCGATDVYIETGDRSLWNALTHLWHSMTERKMYVTGGLGARHAGESFGDDYELPNVTAYAETCAAIANVMWNWRMLLASGEAKYADVMELALYNGVLPGISIDGKEYFYVNPLADRGEHKRQPWFNCACCPPNIARLLASLPCYFYCISSEGIWVNLYAQSTAQLSIDGNTVTVNQRTMYPWEGDVEITIQPKKRSRFSLFLRIPGWCRKLKIQINKEPLTESVLPGRYVEIHRLWKPGDKVQLSLSMPVEWLKCHPLVYENTDRVALARGPLIYCVEQADNPGFDVWNLMLLPNLKITVEWVPNLLNGIVVLKGKALAAEKEKVEGQLYQPEDNISLITRQVDFTAIPYYAWANREPGPMTAWIRTSSLTTPCKRTGPHRKKKGFRSAELEKLMMN
jgi:DUF1680 family protein